MNTDKFDCNICFDEVKEPVVTRCGHLFCWNCILTWMNRSNQQCPVCQAIISKDNVIPLYGRGQDNTDPRNKTSEPRPKPKRPTTTAYNNQTSMFGGYDGRISISFGAFPFSIILPMGFGSGSFGLFNMFRSHEDTSNMTDG